MDPFQTKNFGLGEFDEARPVGAPTGILALLLLELVVCAALLPVDIKLVHVIGYVIGALVVAVTVVLYRSTDRTRRRSARYVIRSGPGVYATAGLVAGVVLAATHAYQFLQRTVVQ